MSSVFETRLIGNIGKDAMVKNLEKGTVAINFPVAHNKNWKDKKTGENKSNTTWSNCTIWKKEGESVAIAEMLKKGTLVELYGTPVAKAFQTENGDYKSEIRLNISSTNILRLTRPEEDNSAVTETDIDKFENDLFNEEEDF